MAATVVVHSPLMARRASRERGAAVTSNTASFHPVVQTTGFGEQNRRMTRVQLPNLTSLLNMRRRAAYTNTEVDECFEWCIKMNGYGRDVAIGDGAWISTADEINMAAASGALFFHSPSQICMTFVLVKNEGERRFLRNSPPTYTPAWGSITHDDWRVAPPLPSTGGVAFSIRFFNQFYEREGM